MSMALMHGWPPNRSHALQFCRAVVRHFRITEPELLGPVEFKFTRCPSIGYDPRYQMPPGAVVHGAGFTAAQVGFDVTTGRPWGQGA